jgi:hypothetical protein
MTPAVAEAIPQAVGEVKRRLLSLPGCNGKNLEIKNPSLKSKNRAPQKTRKSDGKQR